MPRPSRPRRIQARSLVYANLMIDRLRTLPRLHATVREDERVKWQAWQAVAVRQQQAKRRGGKRPGEEDGPNPNAFAAVVVLYYLLVPSAGSNARCGAGSPWRDHTTTPPFPRKQAAFVSSRHAVTARMPCLLRIRGSRSIKPSRGTGLRGRPSNARSTPQ